jgi:hypothetical protein
MNGPARVRVAFPALASIKPLRAVAFLALLDTLWVGARATVLIDDFHAAIAALQAHTVQLFRPPPPALPVAMPITVPPRLPPPEAAVLPERFVDFASVIDAVADAQTAPAPPQTQGLGDINRMVSQVVGLNETSFMLASYHPPRRPPAPGDVAQQAYDRLATGDRRAAAQGFENAAALAPDDPRAAAWSREAARLGRRWSGSAYIFARGAGPPGFASAALLGGGQSGATLAFTPAPLAARPLALTLRGAVAHDGIGIDDRSAQGALGLRWQFMPGLALAGEWLVSSGTSAPSGWTARLTGGASGRTFGLDWNGYAEAGVVNANPYAAGQAFAGWRLPVRGVRVQAGAGVWGAVQVDGSTVDRLDVGPSLRLHAGTLPVDLIVDYRWRVAGNASPGSGVAVTLAGYF